MTLYQYNLHRPQIGNAVFIAESADVIGKVELGNHSNIWHGCVLRGDINKIVVGANTNVQDLSLLHVTEEFPVIVGNNVTIGHKVTLHACKIGNSTLVGMGAIVLDGVEVGDHCLVAAGSLLTPGKKFPNGSLIKGSPAKVERPLTDKELEMYGNHYKSYVRLKEDYLDPKKYHPI